MSGRKIPIEASGRFYENTNPNNCCAVCAQHKILIVQRFPAFYAIHTWMATPTNAMHCIHTWRTREEDPICLRNFTPTSTLVRHRVAFNQLSQALMGRVNLDVNDQIRERLRREMQDQVQEVVRAPRQRMGDLFRVPIRRPAARAVRVNPFDGALDNRIIRDDPPMNVEE